MTFPQACHLCSEPIRHGLDSASSVVVREYTGREYRLCVKCKAKLGVPPGAKKVAFAIHIVPEVKEAQ